jgi:hypothetical protein
MSLIMAIIAYLVIGFILGLGILLAVKGSFWFLIVGVVGYLLAFAWIGCIHH